MKTTDKNPKSNSTHSAHRCRTGKIARLPLAIRQQLNEKMQDGHEGKDLVQWLDGLPEVQAVMAAKFQGNLIREQNLSEWRKGGYQDWEKAQAMREDLTSLDEEIDGLQATAKDGLTHRLAFYQAALLALELKRMKMLPDGLEKAKIMRELCSRLVALRRGDLEVERLALQREKCDLKKKTKEEREEEFWKWADENINRDEFCRRRCYTAEEREAAMDKILGITPAERHEPVPPPAAAPQSQPAPSSLPANPT